MSSIALVMEVTGDDPEVVAVGPVIKSKGAPLEENGANSGDGFDILQHLLTKFLPPKGNSGSQSKQTKAHRGIEWVPMTADGA